MTRTLAIPPSPWITVHQISYHRLVFSVLSPEHGASFHP
jgi:hypothetical protein